MRRRKLLLGLGGLAGTGGIVGSGAFSRITANRDVTVAVADDTDALLKLTPSPTANGEYASLDDGTLGIDLASGEGGDGPGTDSVYEFDDVFRVTNQGTQPVYVWGTFGGASGNFTASGSGTDIWLYPGDDRDTKLRDDGDGVVLLGVGETVNVGLHVDTHDVTSDQTLAMTIHADAERPEGSSGSGPATRTIIVDEDGGGDYRTVQPALDSATAGDTILIKPGEYGPKYDGIGHELRLEDPGGLTIEGDGASREDVTVRQQGFRVEITSPGGNGLTVRNLVVDGGSEGSIGQPAFNIFSDDGVIPADVTFENVALTNHVVSPGELAFESGVDGLRIVDSTVEDAGISEGDPYDGLHIDGVAKDIDIRETTFNNNSEHGIRFDALTEADDISITESNFVNNAEYGVALTDDSDDGISITVSGSYFGGDDDGFRGYPNTNGAGKVTGDVTVGDESADPIGELPYE